MRNKFIADEDLDFERKIREDNLIKPLTAPGQDKGSGLFGGLGDDDDDDIVPLTSGSPFGTSSNPFNTGGSASPFGAPQTSSPFGAPQTSSPFGAPTRPQNGLPPFGQQPEEPKKEIEDYVIDGVKTGAKSSYNILVKIVELVKASTATSLSLLGGYMVTTGAALFVAFALFTFIWDPSMFPFMAGGGVMVASGMLLVGFNHDKAQAAQVQEEEPEVVEEEYDGVDWFADDTEDEDDDDFGFDPFEEEEEVDILDNIEDEVDMYADMFDSMVQSTNSPDAILASVTTDQYGLHSKSNVFEKVLPLLEHAQKNFSVQAELSELSHDFIEYAAQIRGLSGILKLPQGQQLELLKVEQGHVTDILYIDRPTDSKAGTLKLFDEEFTAVLSYRGGTQHDTNVYTTTMAVGNQWITTVTKGTSGMVSIGDAIQVDKDFMLDPGNTLPVLIGYAPDGSIIKADLKDIESMLIAGMPRSGKTWFVKSILGQLALFHSPKEVIFYIADTKGTGSDFYEFKTPHVMKFESEVDGILSMLHWLTTVEAAKRSEILTTTKSKNIWEHNERSINEPLPVLYVVIDEMVSLAAELNTEEMNTYRGYLQQLVTKLPSVGIRLIGLPHVLKHDVIGKTVSDMVGFKVSVGGDAEHIQTTTGATKRDFPYTLTNKGDTAVKGNIIKGSLRTTDVEYCRAFVLGKTNDSIDGLFDFSNDLWSKLLPDTVVGSRAEEV